MNGMHIAKRSCELVGSRSATGIQIATCGSATPPRWSYGGVADTTLAMFPQVIIT